MNIEAYDAESLRKLVRLLEYENRLLKDKLKKEEQADGRILRSLKFRFPVFFNGKEMYELDWDNEPWRGMSAVEENYCLSRS